MSDNNSDTDDYSSGTVHNLPSDEAFIQKRSDRIVIGDTDPNGDEVPLTAAQALMVYELLRVGDNEIPYRYGEATDFSLTTTRGGAHSAAWIESPEEPTILHGRTGEEVVLDPVDLPTLKDILNEWGHTLEEDDRYENANVTFPGSPHGTDGLAIPAIREDYDRLLENFFVHQGLFDPEAEEYLWTR